eukprot:comp22203_c0_seq2/m.32657 comp22203_c0_seq2/g.32657  ORF comp22203_c0_seq2/g.32657 comp22203_c0_seq2/m.32657 type:complete len:437 (-) comp22203_c0_seq2:121-1431(-)
MDTATERKLEQLPTFKPWFNYLSLIIMVGCLIAEIVINGGIEHIGVSVQTVSVTVPVFGMSEPQPLQFATPDNMWIGPNSFTLIEMGAKYSPCMRRDNKTMTAIADMNAQFKKETWGCCQLQDNTCAQTPQAYCQTGAGALEKPVQKWVGNATCESLNCKIINRPCCIGIYGQCAHVSAEQCHALSGSWREDGELCQNYDNCLNDVCKMGGLQDPQYPNQWWRFVTPIFLHVGVLHFVMNALFQLSVGFQIEKSCGWLRFFIIFMVAGIGGNIISGLFSPFSPQVGSSGALYGLLSVLLIELFQSWQILLHPWKEFFKLFVVIFFSLFIGTLPWIDNFAHMGGFLFGIPAAVVFLPYITFGKWDRRRKILLIVVGAVGLIVFFVGGFILFFTKTETFCTWCLYFNCIPYTEDFCSSNMATWDGTFLTIPYSVPQQG